MNPALATTVILALSMQPLPGSNGWNRQMQARVEDQVAHTVEALRNSAHLSRLKRVPASKVELQLTCSAAVTGKDVYDPRFSGFKTYVTNDLKTVSDELKQLAVWSREDSSRYSVVVVRDKSSSVVQMRYRVGIARRPGPVAEFFAPLTYDNPIRDANDWKNQVVPACRNVK